MAVIKKAKRRVTEEKWSIQMECPVKIIKTGHYPTTVIVKLPNGKEVETDLEYLADLQTNI